MVFTLVIIEKIFMSVFIFNFFRIQYCIQEIIVFREDFVNKMCRNLINLLLDLKDIFVQLTKIILVQVYICFILFYVRLIYWIQDYFFRVYFVLDLMILVDKYDLYICFSLECVSINFSFFVRNEFVFKVYWFLIREIEDCKISD